MTIRATLSFTLPDDADEFDAAVQGRDAAAALWSIDKHCRAVVKQGDSSEYERLLAHEIIKMIEESGVSIE